MKRVGILHITDLHCSQEPGESVGEVKDPAVSSWFESELTYEDSFTLFQQRIYGLLRDKQVDVLAFSGDIGWGKEPDTLKLGIRKLATIRDRLNVPKDKVLIAPGNHDLKRDAEPGRELDEFVAACQAQGFSFAEKLQPQCITVQNMPLIALNTCLGGTEHAIHGVPGSFWDDVRTALQKLLRGRPDAELLDAMDIPAVGHTQLNVVEDHMREAQGNCVIVLGHHPPLPTHNQEVRPYATLVDAGQLVFRLVDSGCRVLYLHGHTHCSSCLVAHSPELQKDGFVACIGDRGLLGPDGATATYVQVITDDGGDFRTATVCRYQKSGASMRESASFSVWDMLGEHGRMAVDIKDLDSNKILSFEDVRRILRIDPEHSDQLACELLHRGSRRQLRIDNVLDKYENWNIVRNV